MEKVSATIQSLAEQGLCVQFHEAASLELSQQLLAFAKALREAFPCHELEIIPAYQSLTLIAYEVSLSVVRQSLESLLARPPKPMPVGIRHEIPVCYDPLLGTDLLHVAEALSLEVGELIRLHTEPDYPVHMLGFLPGFLYLGGLNPSLAFPRKVVPDMAVPAGSVGIGGNQTGVYPIESPGGWQILGRTPKRLFLPDSDEPFPIAPLDSVKFMPIELDTYYALEKGDLS